jgi:hypothetical protein
MLGRNERNLALQERRRPCDRHRRTGGKGTVTSPSGCVTGKARKTADRRHPRDVAPSEVSEVDLRQDTQLRGPKRAELHFEGEAGARCSEWK